MKKRVISVLYAVAFLLTLTACGSAEKPESHLGGETTASNTVQTARSSRDAPVSPTEDIPADPTVPASDDPTPLPPGDPTTPPTTTPVPQQPAEIDELIAMLDSVCGEQGITDAMLERSVKAEGNRTRIAQALKKARDGKEVTISFIGGSITEGASATSTENTYAGRVAEWWRTAFPNAVINVVNAGIGSSGSLIGVHRVQDDLLSKEPDFVIVEFAVNDHPVEDPLETETYEGLIRRLLNSPCAPGVLLLSMVTYDGSSAQEAQARIGSHYDLPMVSYCDAVWPEVQNGHYTWESLAADTVHPNNTGHAIAAAFIEHYLLGVYEQIDNIPSGAAALPAPLTPNRFEHATILDSTDLTPTSRGSFTVMPAAYRTWKGWSVSTNGAPITFELNDVKNVFVLIQMRVGGNAAVASVNGVDVLMTSRAQYTYSEASKPLYMSETADDIILTISPNGPFTILGIMVS